jgi:hypothetical protein
VSGEGAKFAAEVKAWAEKAKARPELAIERFIVNLGYTLLSSTPIGDPSLWKRKPPKNYVPGALMANWNFSIGLIDESNGKPPNRSVNDAVDRLEVVLDAGVADKDVYLVNAQPYARRLEYEGFSSQVPAGWVRITAVQAPELMNQAIQQVSR